MEIITQYLGYVMWGILAIFVVTVIIGMIWGMARGWKRTLKRMLVVLPMFIVAIFLAPLISYLVMISPLGTMLKDWVYGILGMGDDATFNALLVVDGLEAFIWGIPLILVNVIIFYILLLSFRFIVSPLFSLIFFRKVAPKKDSEGNKIRHSKLAGLGMGALFGVIIFAFIWMPLTGMMATLDRIDRYEPRIHSTTQVDFTNINITDTEFDKTLSDVNIVIREVNSEVNGSVFGVITKYTGMQIFGRFTLGHLTTIRAGHATTNTIRDVEVGAELIRDAIVLADLAANIDNPREDLIPVFNNQQNIEYFQSIINKSFRLGLVRLALDSNFEDFLSHEDVNVLRDFDVGGFVGDDEKLQDRFKDSIYTAIGSISSDIFRQDSLALLEATRLMFANHRVNATTNANLWEAIDDVIEVLARETVDNGDLDKAFASLSTTLKFQNTNENANWNGNNLAEQIFDQIGGNNIFTNLLFNEENSDLYALPIAHFLNMQPEDIIIDAKRMTAGFANITTRIVDIGSTVYKLVDSGGDIVAMANILDESDAIVAIGEILELLTNDDDWTVGENKTPTMGTNRILRKYLSDLIDEQFTGSEDGAISVEAVLGPLLDKLAVDGPNIAWSKELGDIVTLILELREFLTDLDPDALLEKLLSGGEDGLLDLIAESPLLSGIVVNMIDAAINESAPDGVSFDFGTADNKKVIEAIGSLGDVTKLMEDAEGADFNDIDEIIELFGGEEGGDENTLVMLADAGVKINIDSEKNPGFEESLDEWLETLDADDPLRRIESMFR